MQHQKPKGTQEREPPIARQGSAQHLAFNFLAERVGNLECHVSSLGSKMSEMGQALEDIEADIRSTITCRVCYKHAPVDGFTHVNVLSCGHAFCSLCAFTMVHCATCRAPVVGKFKLFL